MYRPQIDKFINEAIAMNPFDPLATMLGLTVVVGAAIMHFLK